MPVIDPSGLFQGQRLAACSDMAQLYWPRLYCAANRCARLELHLASLISQCFRNFNQPPTEGQLWQIFEEYVANFLVIPYQADGGRLWVEFATDEKYLPRYKTGDEKSPKPPKQSRDAFAKGYEEWKLRHGEKELPKNFGNLSELLQKSFGDVSEKFLYGVGVGVGVGEERESIREPALTPNGVSLSSPKRELKIRPNPSLGDFAECYSQHHGELVAMREFTDERKRKLHERKRKGLTLELWKQGIVKAASTDFCVGKNSRKRRFTIDDLLDAEIFNKLMEGGYDSAKKQPKQSLSTLDEEYIRNA